MAEVYSKATWGWQYPFTMEELASWGWLGATAFEDVTDYCTEAKARLAEQYKNSPLLQGLLCSLIAEYENLEMVFYDMKLNRAIDTATVQQLDELGAIVVLPRKGLDDTAYREAIRAQIYYNTSNGTAEDVISFVKTVTNATAVLYNESYPAGINIFTNGNNLPENLFINAKAITAGGVKIVMVTSAGSEEQFAFDPEGFVDPEAVGFGELTLSTEGGTLTERIS